MQTPISQHGQQFQFDVLIIGSGLAGVSYALELLAIQPNTKIALTTKETLSHCNSAVAQGGIAAVAPTQDSLQQHIDDTLSASDGLALLETVKSILEYGPKSVQQLIHWGVQFDKKNNAYDLAREGGHSCRRIYHNGDRTGHAIMSPLIQKIKQSSQITLFEYTTAVNLITENVVHTPGSQPEVLGAYVLDEKTNQIHTLLAHAVILATGGAGKVYRYTTNIDIATGDGIAMAYRAGARIGNLEFYQFHPTLLYHNDVHNFLITEAIRGEGAYLLRPDTKKRFMKDYAPEKMELSTRDIVARAIFNEIERADQSFVYLDIRHQSPSFLKKRFPQIFNTLLKLGLDIRKDLIPIVPGAHFLCGGVLSDIAGQTDIRRLYTIGETAFTGLHGANRLASNSLLENVVMAHFAAKDTIKWLSQPIYHRKTIKNWDSKSVTDLRRAGQISSHWRGLRGEMTAYAGMIRTEEGLKDLLNLILVRKKMIEHYYWQHTITRDLIELRNITLIAELITRSALRRHESRGGHYREDFPNKNQETKETILHSGETEIIFD